MRSVAIRWQRNREANDRVGVGVGMKRARLPGLAAVAAASGTLLIACSNAEDYTATCQRADGSPASWGEGPSRAFEVQAYAGSDHCGWQSTIFLSAGWPPGTVPDTADDIRQFIRDPDDNLIGFPMLGSLDTDIELPSGARFSGYHTDRAELWFGPDDGSTYAYLKLGDRVERWPRPAEIIACE